MSPTKQTRAERQQRLGIPPRQRTPEPARAAPTAARVIPLLAAGVTLWAAVPPLWPGLGVPVTWSSLVFGLTVGVAAIIVARTATAIRRPGHALATARTAALLALLVTVPVVFDPRALNGFNGAKFTAILIGALAMVGVWAVEAVAPGPPPRWRNGLHWPVLALVVWTAVTTATSVSPRLSILGATGTNDGLLAAAALAVIFVAVVQAVTMDQVKAVLSVLYFGAGLPIVVYGLIQLHDRLWPGGRWDWVGKISGEGMQTFADGRIFSTLGNPNHLGGFLAVLVPVGLVLFLLERSRLVRVLIAALMAGVLVELLQSASRGAMLAALIALGVAAALLWPEVRRRTNTSFPVVGAVAAAVVLAALGMAAAPQFNAKVSGLDPAATVRLRADLWKLGVAMANDRPLVGHGPDTWLDRSPKYQDAETVGRLGGTGYHANGPHNLFVSQLAATGYPGLTLLLAVLAFATMRAVGTWKRLRQVESDGSREDEQSRARQARLCLTAVVAGLAAFLAQASFNVNQIGLSLVFWVLLGLLCVLSLGAGVPTSLRPGALVSRPPETVPLQADVGAHGRQAPRASQRRPAQGGDLVTGAAAVVVGVGLCLGVSIATRPLRADHNAAASTFDVAMARGAPRDEATRLSRRAATRLDNAIALNPWEASYLVRRGDRFFASALSFPPGSPAQTTALDSARRDYQRVVDLRPYNAGFLLRYADHLLRVHERDPGEAEARADAIRLLRRAVGADPYAPAQRIALERALSG